MAKNRRKEKRYIEFRDLRWLVPAPEWGDYLRRGLTVRVSNRLARLRRGVEIVWDDGKHLLRDSARRRGPDPLDLADGGRRGQAPPVYPLPGPET